jgi:putative transposase
MSVTRKIVQQYGGVPDIWQRNYYEHIIQNDEEPKRIHLYIESNPIHWISDYENPEMTP